MTVDSELQKRILEQWYAALDADYGEHSDPESGCNVCYEASLLGIIGDKDV
jgi:hypothetical protein